MSKKDEIRDELKAFDVNIPLIGMPQMAVPDGYFDHFSDELNEKIRVDSFLNRLPSSSPFGLPDNYFDKLDDNIREKREMEQFLSSLPLKTPFDVDKQYFAQFQQNIVETIHTEDFLATLPKTAPYQLSAQYFDQFSAKVLAKAVQASRLNPLRATRTFYSKMSIAASLLIILSIGFLLMTGKTSHANLENQLAQISDSEIEAYIQEHSYEFDNHISYQGIDESKIDIKKLESDIYNDYFESISEEEINNFL